MRHLAFLKVLGLLTLANATPVVAKSRNQECDCLQHVCPSLLGCFP